MSTISRKEENNFIISPFQNAIYIYMDNNARLQSWSSIFDVQNDVMKMCEYFHVSRKWHRSLSASVCRLINH